MARISKNSPLEGLSGSIGKQLVFKAYGNTTVVSKHPDMSKVKPSRRQTEKQVLFKQAVAYAQSIIRNPEKRQAYAAKLPKGKSVYHAALQDFMKNAG